MNTLPKGDTVEGYSRSASRYAKASSGLTSCFAHFIPKSEAEAQKEERCSPDETTLAMTFIQKKYLLLERSLWLPPEGILVRMFRDRHQTSPRTPIGQRFGQILLRGTRRSSATSNSGEKRDRSRPKLFQDGRPKSWDSYKRTWQRSCKPMMICG